MEEIVWLMDSDICDKCDGFVDGFGICTDCGWDGIENSEWEEWDEDDSLYEDWYNEQCTTNHLP